MLIQSKESVQSKKHTSSQHTHDSFHAQMHINDPWNTFDLDIAGGESLGGRYSFRDDEE